MKRVLSPVVSCAFLLLALSPIDVARGENFSSATRQHQELNHEVGVWDAEVTMWMTPDAEPMKSKAVETNEMLGEMWLVSKFEGEFGGQKYSGRGQTGYNPIEEKFVGTWIDTMSPFMFSMEGEYDEDSHTLTMIGEGINFMTGEEHKSKMVTRYTGEDTKVFEMYMPSETEEGKWWKHMEAKYTRRN